MTDAEQLTTAVAIENAFMSTSEYDGEGSPATMVDGLFAIARSIGQLADAVKEANGPDSGTRQLARAVVRLGNGDANTPFGAIESLSMQLREGLDGIATAFYESERQRQDARSEE